MKNYVETHTMMRRGGVIMGLRADWNYILQSRYRNPKELDLFRTLMEVLQMRNRQYVFIEETHSIVRVGYLSPKLGYKQVNKEIADLLIIYNDTKNKEIRISFLQATQIHICLSGQIHYQEVCIFLLIVPFLHTR